MVRAGPFVDHSGIEKPFTLGELRRAVAEARAARGKIDFEVHSSSNIKHSPIIIAMATLPLQWFEGEPDEFPLPQVLN